MGQILGIIQDNCSGTEWKNVQLRKITDKVFDHFKDESGQVNLTSEDLYIAVLLVYNDINKYLPGPHIDPPSKLEVKALIKTYDLNRDGELDREEFAGFIQKLTTETLTLVSQKMIITLVAAPAVAIMTKKATEGVPGVGKVVQRVPVSVYASLVTLAVLLIQKSSV